MCVKAGQNILVVMIVCVPATLFLLFYNLRGYAPTAPLIFSLNTELRELGRVGLRSPPPPKPFWTTSSLTETPRVTPTAPSKPFLPCDWNLNEIPRETRMQVSLHCNETSVDILYTEVQVHQTPVTTIAENHTSCLERVILSHCYDAGLRIPRLAHYVWFGDRYMRLYTFVSVLSVVRFLRPCLVLFHGDVEPFGPYWVALLQLVPNIIFVQRTRPRHIFGNVINLVEHSADVARLQVLIEYGGVYVDTDQYLLRPVEPLLGHSVVIGTELEGAKCGNGLIFSQSQAPFLKLWLASYVTFNDAKWGDHSTYLPYNLSRGFPHLVTVVDSFFRPNFKHIQPLYLNSSYDWSDIYALHLYYRFYFDHFDTETRLDEQDCVVGEMTRHVLFGTKDSCWEGGATERLQLK